MPRSAVRFVLLFVALPLLAGCGADEATRTPWTLVYVMSYDNDLEKHAATVLDRLQDGVAGTRNVVTVLADYRGPGGLVRYEIDGTGRRAVTLGTDDSASETVVAGYLNWAFRAHPARKYAVVFLNHGGGLDELCQDLHPADSPEGRWLSARRLGPILRRLRDGADGEVELLFLQQCGRATIEGLYNFRGAARAVLASQTRVGAPNTYYGPTLRRLDRDPAIDGFALAARIVREDDHFNSYVCVDGGALREAPAHLDRVVEEVAASVGEGLRAPEGAALCFTCWIRPDEKFHDLLDWLAALYETNGIPADRRTALRAFGRWVEERLVTLHERHGRTAHMMTRWTGLGVLVPETAAVLERYRGYPLYEDSDLDALWRRLVPSD